ncbi:MAG: cyclic nucleotide-binding/CBS domain-containing protein [Pyrobaculum sp.]
MKVASVARRDVVTCFPNTPLHEVAEVMVRKGVGSVVVVNPTSPTKPLGIIGERDVLRAYVLGVDPNTPASQVMNKLVATVDAEAHVAEVVMAMKENNIRRVVVIRGGELYGVVALRDILFNIPALKAVVDYFS